MVAFRDIYIISSLANICRDWCQKFATGTFAHNSKTVNDTVKSQTRGQNYWSRALKWGIVHFCSSSTFGDTTEYMKI